MRVGVISNSECVSDAQAVKELIKKELPQTGDIESIFTIGATIGVHTGPGDCCNVLVGRKNLALEDVAQ